MTLKDFYSLLARLFLGYVFFSSGLCKLAGGHFGQLIGPPNIIADLQAYGLASFGVFLAFSQVLTGALVLSQRWSVLGLVMLVPMNASILAATLSMQWQGTPSVNAFLLTINLLALLYEWKTLRFFILPDTQELRHPTRIQQLFPDFWLPVGVVILALIAAISASFFRPLMLTAGVLTLVLAWLNVWRAAKISWLPRLTLAASLLAIVSLSLTEELVKLNFSIYGPLLTGIALTILSTAAISLRVWFSKTRKMI